MGSSNTGNWNWSKWVAAKQDPRKDPLLAKLTTIQIKCSGPSNQTNSSPVYCRVLKKHFKLRSRTRGWVEPSTWPCGCCGHQQHAENPHKWPQKSPKNPISNTSSATIVDYRVYEGSIHIFRSIRGCFLMKLRHGDVGRRIQKLWRHAVPTRVTEKEPGKDLKPPVIYRVPEVVHRLFFLPQKQQ